MRGRKQKDSAAPTQDAAATPFFARFLEDQHGGDAEAKVTTRRGRAQAVAGSRSTKKTTATQFQTLKYPSDRDEWVLCPYHVEAATAKAGATRQTLKYPSDRDEIECYFPVYLNAADAPKTARAKPKKDAKVRLTTKAADSDQVAS
jgi:Serine endopeptidase inhibitors